MDFLMRFSFNYTYKNLIELINWNNILIINGKKETWNLSFLFLLLNITNHYNSILIFL